MTDLDRPQRWPHWVYGVGEEPDYRFSFANERTFLAWIRTSLALLAAAVALDVVDLSVSEPLQEGLAAVLSCLGLISAVAAWFRWATAERAIRKNAPLPSLGFSVVLVIGVVITGIVALFVGF